MHMATRALPSFFEMCALVLRTRPVNAERDDLPPEWDVTRILDSRFTTRGRTQCLIRWEGYGAQADRWINEEDIFADDVI